MIPWQIERISKILLASCFPLLTFIELRNQQWLRRRCEGEINGDISHQQLPLCLLYSLHLFLSSTQHGKRTRWGGGDIPITIRSRCFLLPWKASVTPTWSDVESCTFCVLTHVGLPNKDLEMIGNLHSGKTASGRERDLLFIHSQTLQQDEDDVQQS